MLDQVKLARPPQDAGYASRRRLDHPVVTASFSSVDGADSSSAAEVPCSFAAPVESVPPASRGAGEVVSGHVSRCGVVPPLAASDEAATESGQRTRRRNRLIANFLAAFLTAGGVAYGRAASSTASPTRIELCAQAGVRELLITSLHGCVPLDRSPKVFKAGLRSNPVPILLASVGPPPALATPGGLSGQGDRPTDPIQTSVLSSPAGPGGPVGTSCSTATATVVSGVGPPALLDQSR